MSRIEGKQQEKLREKRRQKMIGKRPICEDCKHLHDELEYKCDAYPEGVPVEIIIGDVNHKKPYKGDGGIRFEKIVKTGKK